MLSIIQAAGWPIWPLIACSILALALIFERFASLKASKVAPTNLLNEAISVSTKHLPSAETTQQLAQSSVLGEVLATGLRTRQAHPESSEEELRSAMEGAGRAAAHKLEKYLSALATIASAAPLLGRLLADTEIASLSRLAGATLLALSAAKRSKIRARARIEQAIKGQMGHPAACMIDSNVALPRRSKLQSAIMTQRRTASACICVADDPQFAPAQPAGRQRAGVMSCRRPAGSLTRL